MTNVSAVDPRVLSSYCIVVFSLLEKNFLSGVAILFFIDLKHGKTLQKFEENYKELIKRIKNYKNSLLLVFLGKYSSESLVSAQSLYSVDDASD